MQRFVPFSVALATWKSSSFNDSRRKDRHFEDLQRLGLRQSVREDEPSQLGPGQTLTETSRSRPLTLSVPGFFQSRNSSKNRAIPKDRR